MKLPGRNSSIFLGLTSTLATLAIYDKFKKKQIIAAACKSVSDLSLEPLHVHDLPRKVRVLITDSSYARYTFRTFVKPVFDAAALDYAVVYSPAIRSHILDLVAAGKREAIPEPPPPSRGFMGLFSPSQKPPFDPIHAFRTRPVYNPKEDLVVVGHEAWIDTLESLDTACRTPLVPALNEDGEIVLMDDVDNLGIALPKLAFIPGRNLTGWKWVPYKMYRWMRERDVGAEVCDAAVAVARADATRDFIQSDFGAGQGHGLVGMKDGVGEDVIKSRRVREALQVYDMKNE